MNAMAIHCIARYQIWSLNIYILLWVHIIFVLWYLMYMYFCLPAELNIPFFNRFQQYSLKWGYTTQPLPILTVFRNRLRSALPWPNRRSGGGGEECTTKFEMGWLPHPLKVRHIDEKIKTHIEEYSSQSPFTVFNSFWIYITLAFTIYLTSVWLATRWSTRNTSGSHSYSLRETISFHMESVIYLKCSPTIFLISQSENQQPIVPIGPFASRPNKYWGRGEQGQLIIITQGIGVVISAPRRGSGSGMIGGPADMIT
jgi:hypothetical protein